MYDCICCEEPSASFPLRLAELKTPKHSLLISSYQYAMSPDDFIPHNIYCEMKEQSTLLDVICGDELMMGITNNNSNNNNILNFESCLLLCARCGYHIGDGQLNAVHEDKGMDDSSPRNEVCKLMLSDIQDVRLLRNRVQLNITSRNNAIKNQDKQEDNIRIGVEAIISTYTNEESSRGSGTQLGSTFFHSKLSFEQVWNIFVIISYAVEAPNDVKTSLICHSLS